MSYEDEKKKAGRESAFFVELLLDYCDHVYGTAPCAAALGVTGAVKCYNTRKTCQDPANYSPSPKTYRFVKPGPNWPAGFERISSLRSLSQSTTEIDPEGGLGKRGMVTLEFQDHPHHDRGIDKYVSERAYDPEAQGTFWGKLRARNPYHKGRTLRVYEGYMTEPFDLANFKSRDYIIESISPPDASGRVRVVAKDILKLADGEKAVCPLPTTGVLAKDLAPDGKTIYLTAGTGVQYDGDNHVEIGGEKIKFTARDGDRLTGCVRGQWGTEIKSHSAGDKVQLCKTWENVNVVDLIDEQFTDFAGIQATSIDAANFADEKATHLSTFNLSNCVGKPTPVRELVQQVMQLCLIAVWQDDDTSKIKIKSLTPWASSVASITDAQLVGGSLSITDMPDTRISRVRVYHGAVNFSEDDDPKNYRKLYFDPNLSNESSAKYGEKAERVFFARWFTADDVTRPALLASRLIDRYGDVAQKIGLKLDERHATFRTGDVIDLTTRMQQDAEGNAEQTRVLITKRMPDGKGHQVGYIGVTYSAVPEAKVNIGSLANRGISNQIEVFTLLSAPAEAVDVTITNEAGSIIYSDEPTQAALASGPLPAGSTIKLINKGHIYGCGGKGGKGGIALAARDPEGWITVAGEGGNGEAAGPAVESSVDITIDNTEGYIFGGGGGGAGGAGYGSRNTVHGGGGGGAGQSYSPRRGGSGGIGMGYSEVATIYTSESGTSVKANPFKNGANGKFYFYAPRGSYVLVYDFPDGTKDWVSGINLAADPSQDQPQNLGSGSAREPVTVGGGGSGTPVRTVPQSFQMR